MGQEASEALRVLQSPSIESLMGQDGCQNLPCLPNFTLSSTCATNLPSHMVNKINVVEPQTTLLYKPNVMRPWLPDADLDFKGAVCLQLL